MANKQKEYQGYKPPFTLSARAVGLVADIAAQMERFAIRMEQDDALRLRKANRIKTIHSSLAIEGNHLLESEWRTSLTARRWRIWSIPTNKPIMMPSHKVPNREKAALLLSLCWVRFWIRCADIKASL